MISLLALEKRWSEFANKPKSQEEIQETLELAKKIELLRAKEYKCLIKELKEIGININSIWDLVNSKLSYKRAIPILIEHLDKPYRKKNKEGLIRALAVKEAKGLACEALVTQYNKTNDENLKLVIRNSIDVVIDKDCANKVIEIALNEKNGDSRQMFVSALQKIRSDKAKNALNVLVNDKSQIISKEARNALKFNL